MGCLFRFYFYCYALQLDNLQYLMLTTKNWSGHLNGLWVHSIKTCGSLDICSHLNCRVWWYVIGCIVDILSHTCTHENAHNVGISRRWFYECCVACFSKRRGNNRCYRPNEFMTHLLHYDTIKERQNGILVTTILCRHDMDKLYTLPVLRTMEIYFPRQNVSSAGLWQFSLWLAWINISQNSRTAGGMVLGK